MAGRAHIVLVCILIFIFVNALPNQAESQNLWGDLEPGSYKIGFRTIEKYDYSRVFRAKTDYMGNPVEGERARPIQICIWYPAQINSDDIPMTYGEYAFPYPQDESMFTVLSALQDREVQYLIGLTHGQDVSLSMMSGPMTAVRDAPAVEEDFPVLVYFSDITASYAENAVLCEYLASYGYIVISTHSLGISSLIPGEILLEMETIVRDKEFALGILKSEEHMTIDNVGVIGHGFGAAAALNLAANNPDVRAVVCLNGWTSDPSRFDFIRSSPAFSIDRITAPIMSIIPADTNSSGLSLIEDFNYTSRSVINQNRTEQIIFTDYPMFSLMFGQTHSDETVPLQQAYEANCKFTLKYLDAYLKSGLTDTEVNSLLVETGNSLENIGAITFMAAEEIPPTQADFASMIASDYIDTAVAIFYHFNEKDPDLVLFAENFINAHGYRLLQTGRPELAVKVFKLNTAKYPKSPNSWDSLSDAYLALNEGEDAAACMHKALELIKTDTTTDPTLKEQIRTKCEHTLQSMHEQNQ